MVANHEPIDRTATAPARAELERRIAHRTITRLAGRVDVIGDALALCMGVHGVDERILAGYLGCSMRGLVRLALLRRPDPATPGFEAAVDRVAAATDADGARLLDLLDSTDRCRGRTAPAYA